MTTPAETVGAHVAALIRGDALPAPLSADFDALQGGIAELAGADGRTQAVMIARSQFALQVLTALNHRLAAEVRTARALGNARAR